MYKYIHTCIYIHISCPRTYTHTHIYTHAYKMYIWTHAKHVWNDGAAATAREDQLDAKKLCPAPCPLQFGGGYPSWPAPQSPVHEEWCRISSEQPQPTAAHRTITTARRPDRIRLSALVRSQSTQFTRAPSFAARPWPPETRSFFCHFGGFFFRIFGWIFGRHLMYISTHFEDILIYIAKYIWPKKAFESWTTTLYSAKTYSVSIYLN